MIQENETREEAAEDSSAEGGDEARELTPLEEEILSTLKSVYDPEIPVDIYELGLIYDFGVNAEGKVDVKMTLTSPACRRFGLPSTSSPGAR